MRLCAIGLMLFTFMMNVSSVKSEQMYLDVYTGDSRKSTVLFKVHNSTQVTNGKYCYVYTNYEITIRINNETKNIYKQSKIVFKIEKNDNVTIQTKSFVFVFRVLKTDSIQQDIEKLYDEQTVKKMLLGVRMEIWLAIPISVILAVFIRRRRLA